MLVTRQNFDAVVEHLLGAAPRAVDCETTGLHPYKESQLFSIIIADSDTAYYFNFYEYEQMSAEHVLPREYLARLKPIFNNPNSLWFMHNAKFDMAFLYKEGLEVAGIVHCTLAIARVEYNAHLKYSLAECAERIGHKKDDAVEEYITKHKLYEMVEVPGKKQKSKNKFFTLVPFDIMQRYGEQDARVTYELGVHQLQSIKDFSNSVPSNKNSPINVMENERQLTKTCFNIERVGVLIDKKYCKEAVVHEKENMEKASKEFEQLTGSKLVNSSKHLAGVFAALGETFPKTEKGNDSFDKNVLTTLKHPAARTVEEYRKAEKRAAYFYSYLYYADRDGVVHADIKQSGTESGRVSYGNPNFQNVPKRGEDNSLYPVRRAIIPRSGYYFFELDFKAAEYRLMVDYSMEMDLVNKINAGLDVHTACQELMGLSDRDTAKTMNFMKLYGGGAQKLADSLNISLQKAYELSDKYWASLPRVAQFIKTVSHTAKVRGYVMNWFGRVCRFPDPRFSYAAPNHLIQGGCADAVKVAMNKLDLLFSDKKSRMLLQVHDSILFEVHETELSLVTEIKKIMENAYPFKNVPLLCDVSWSNKSWGDLEDYS